MNFNRTATENMFIRLSLTKHKPMPLKKKILKRVLYYYLRMKK